MKNIFGNIVNLFFALAGFVILILIAFRVICRSFSKEKKVYAEITDKQCRNQRIYEKSQAPHSERIYTITFLCNRKKLYFDVSEQTYLSCRINQRGVLTFKGDRFMDFTAKDEK